MVRPNNFSTLRWGEGNMHLVETVLGILNYDRSPGRPYAVDELS